MQYIEIKELPKVIQDALISVNYHCKDILWETREEVDIQVAGGDGRKGFVILVDISGQVEMKIYWGSWGGANMFSPKNQVDLDSNNYKIPENMCVIKGTIGEKTFANLFFSPTNIMKSLNAVENLSKEKACVLAIYKTLKPAYRKNHLEGKEVLIEELINEGYLKRTGVGISITTKGKNSATKMF